MFRITAMDHIVLNVEDMDTILDFYTNVLGLEPERLEEFRQGKVGFPSVRISADTVIDLFPVKEPAPARATPPGSCGCPLLSTLDSWAARWPCRPSRSTRPAW